MIKSSVTIALVPEIKQGPWIYWQDLEASIRKAAVLGFDGVELFTSSAEAVDAQLLLGLVEKYAIKISAVGTGAGKVIHGLTLTDPDPENRQKAVAFIAQMMSFGAQFQAPAIIGSMQGNAGSDRAASLADLAEALRELGELALSLGVHLIYEPLNRYETNLFNRLEDAAQFLEEEGIKGVGLLADLFHMNIEERDLAESIRQSASWIRHVHFADSNRRPIGNGHSEINAVSEALKEIGYNGYVSAEAFPWPDSDAAAAQTIHSFNQYFKI
jgi:sugar phosphate isomerase/epimerase